ncbi:TetR/AcrR family transcriptional regulator [Paenibacillus xylanexedens]|uniref:TetR/AcrR family transcriptional repressor of nem operon n=1 Tax=Paenibacillus xylanexedens TaxID=528191 RepID=A0ABS4RUR6_PAEXY|nr:TetR/AcrR family transcriptional regulator [Paenibacillus xylanexedens]MBP2246616.1 TetR/AcrR family transcriptional repressor of nem operon [Paenibacillus xylanexedens]
MARSKEFEVNEVLDKAMKIFWEQGYEKTSMSDLVEHMGIHRRSIYDTFDDKHSLFLQAMDRYRGKVSTTLLAEIKASKTAVEALHKIFEVMISEAEDTPSGCLIVNSAVELGTRDQEVDNRSLESFNEAERMFEQIIQWGQREGEFSSDHDAKEMAEYLHNISVGIRAMARTSTDKEKLNRIIHVTMKLLEK